MTTRRIVLVYAVVQALGALALLTVVPWLWSIVAVLRHG